MGCWLLPGFQWLGTNINREIRALVYDTDTHTDSCCIAYPHSDCYCDSAVKPYANAYRDCSSDSNTDSYANADADTNCGT